MGVMPHRFKPADDGLSQVPSMPHALLREKNPIDEIDRVLAADVP
jgi:hypothetical protein